MSEKPCRRVWPKTAHTRIISDIEMTKSIHPLDRARFVFVDWERDIGCVRQIPAAGKLTRSGRLTSEITAGAVRFRHHAGRLKFRVRDSKFKVSSHSSATSSNATDGAKILRCGASPCELQQAPTCTNPNDYSCSRTTANFQPLSTSAASTIGGRISCTLFRLFCRNTTLR